MDGWYIAGPMRGQKHFGFDAFFECEAYLRSMVASRYDVIFNPARRDEDLGFKARAWGLTGHESMEEPIFYKSLTGMAGYYSFDLEAAMDADNDFIRSHECTHIIMIAGWGGSVGARDELALARGLGRWVFYYFADRPTGFRLSTVPLAADKELAERYAEADAQRRFNQMLPPESAAASALAEAVFPTAALGEVRITSETGGQKGQKPERHELIPGRAMDAVARVYAFGAAKYPADEDGVENWLKGYKWRLSLGALFRHVNAVRKGQWLDDESGEPHLAHAVFHCLAMMEWWYAGNTDQNDIYGLNLPEAS